MTIRSLSPGGRASGWAARLALLLSIFAAPIPAQAQPPADSGPVALVVHDRQPGPTISRDIFGQFAEHLGTGIYGGVWVGEDSKIPNVAASAATWSRRCARCGCPKCAGPAAASPTNITGATASARARSGR